MQEIFNFILKYWELILAAILFVVALVISLCNQKGKQLISTLVYSAAPEAILMAEKSGYKGVEKLNYCVGLIFKHLENNVPGIKLASYYGLIVSIVERILSTPQKKGGK